MAFVGQVSDPLRGEREASRQEVGLRLQLFAIARENKQATLGFVIVVLAILIAFLGPLVYSVDPLAVDGGASLHAPGGAHLLGTDTFGRDILARTIGAARLDLLVAFSVAALAFTIGSVAGALAGYVGGWLDELAMRFVDLMLSFPAFILALAITVMLGNHLQNVIGAIAFAYTPYFVRMTRGEALRIRSTEYADAARVVGNPAWRVVLIHVFPNAISPSLVLGSIVLGWAILDASALGFLGIGIKPPTAEWGTMVADGSANIITGQWWTWLFPGAAILVMVLAFNWIGDGLRNLLRSA
jgi:peptide/nickel transport system permease protein